MQHHHIKKDKCVIPVFTYDAWVYILTYEHIRVENFVQISITLYIYFALKAYMIKLLSLNAFLFNLNLLLKSTILFFIEVFQCLLFDKIDTQQFYAIIACTCQIGILVEYTYCDHSPINKCEIVIDTHYRIIVFTCIHLSELWTYINVYIEYIRSLSK